MVILKDPHGIENHGANASRGLESGAIPSGMGD
jgi:hypothetical protein